MSKYLPRHGSFCPSGSYDIDADYCEKYCSASVPDTCLGDGKALAGRKP